MAEAEWIQEQQIDIHGEDRNYILTPPELLHKMHASHLRAWLRNVKILIKASAPHIHNLIRTMDVRQYLQQPRRPGAESGLRTPTCSVRTRPTM
jgi:hypothetical protein